MDLSNKANLKKLFSELEKKKFPPFPENEQITFLLENLIEVDAIYAGLLSSAIGGEKIFENDIPRLESLIKDAHNIKTDDKSDLKILNEMYAYLDLLVKIKEAISKDKK